MKIDWARLFFFLSSAVIVTFVSFGFGLYSGWYRTGGYEAGAFLFRSAKSVWVDLSSDARTVDHSFDEPGLVEEAEVPDPGYLLLAAYFPGVEKAGFRLVRLSDATVVKEWYPDPVAIRKISNLDNLYPVSRFQPSSPLLLEDGGLLFIDEPGPLVRIDSCANVVSVIDDSFHHSLERGLDGGLLVPVKLEELEIVDGLTIINDGIAVVSPEDGVLERVSVFEILERHGHRGFLLGSGPFDYDPIHLNDIKVARTSTRNWQRGDWLLSLRNRSALILYRPSSGEIVWIKQGPWLRQHDPNFLEDGRISVLGNDVVDTPQGGERFYEAASELYVFDPGTGEVTTPFASVFDAERIRTPTQGRARIVGDEHLFVEETDRGRLMRISKDGVIWRYHNHADDAAGALNWSRYLGKLPGDGMAEALRCPEETG